MLLFSLLNRMRGRAFAAGLGGLSVVLLALLAAPGGAFAQESDGDPGAVGATEAGRTEPLLGPVGPPEPVGGARSAEALQAAEAELERARQQLADARARVVEAASELEAEQHAAEEAAKAEAEAKARAAQTASAAVEEAMAPLEGAVAEAVERADRAERVAADASRRVGELEQEVAALRASLAWDRSGPYLGAGVFFAPEIFGDGLDADDSSGAFVRAGYRFAPHFALEGRFDWLDEFDAAGDLARGTVQPWAATLNGRIFLLTQRIQPYVGVGVGAISAEVEGRRFADGSRFRVRETEPAFRGSAGVDLYLTPNLVLNLDAAYIGASGELRDFDFATLGGGLELRF